MLWKLCLKQKQYRYRSAYAQRGNDSMQVLLSLFITKKNFISTLGQKDL